MNLDYCCVCGCDTEHVEVPDEIFGRGFQCVKCKTVWQMEDVIVEDVKETIFH